MEDTATVASQAVVRPWVPPRLWVGCSCWPTRMPCPRVRLLDHPVRLEQEARGYREPERLGGLEIDDEIELHGSEHGQVGGFAPLRILSTYVAIPRQFPARSVV